MKKLLPVFFILAALHAAGQTAGSISIKKIHQKYQLAKNCSDHLDWEEVVLRDKEAEKKINNRIRAVAKTYRLNAEDADRKCRGQLDYEPECGIVFSRNGVISCVFTSYTYYKGGAHGGRRFENLNFNTKSGKEIHFRDLIDPRHAASLDSLILQRLQARLNFMDEESLDHYKEQLGHLNFEFDDKGILINFIGPNYVTSVVAVHFTYDELRKYRKE
jgi:hypothetical protein